MDPAQKSGGEGPRTLRDDAVHFLEHCMYVASGSPLARDGEAIHHALELVAEAFWPDLQDRAQFQYNMETDEIEVETPNALYYIAVRAVERRPCLGDRAERVPVVVGPERLREQDGMRRILGPDGVLTGSPLSACPRLKSHE